MAVENNVISIDALMPAEMAQKAEAIGMKKANLAFWPLFALSILAGAFIALGAIFATTVSAGSSALPYGVARLLTGLVFTVGLILVIIGGAELFTGNNLIIMAFTNGKVTLQALLRNWIIVYLGNFVGSVATAVIMFLTRQYTFGNGSIGLAALNIANGKVNLEFVQAIALGIMCNAMVCMAVWLCYSARSTTDKILAIIPPISGFVASGFEHSIANMYFVPLALFIKQFAPAAFWESKALVDAGVTMEKFANLTWPGFFINNLLPVTIGNIIGGAVLVGLVYWFIFLKKWSK
ncbi:MAG: formate transporter FocA [Bellilinea sp.]